MVFDLRFLLAMCLRVDFGDLEGPLKGMLILVKKIGDQKKKNGKPVVPRVCPFDLCPCKLQLPGFLTR